MTGNFQNGEMVVYKLEETDFCHFPDVPKYVTYF